MKNLVVILFSILISSCSSDNENLNSRNVDSTLISKGNLHGNGIEGISKQNFVISNQTVWNNLISQMDSASNVSDNFTETTIDFSEYTIIAVFDEIKRNGGYDLELNITANSENIIVNITSLVPEEVAPTVITQPYYIVKIKNSNLAIIFE
ncbi:protease complex subunit PrcB family protein [Tenacibaculum sp. SG-28]|uniref:protease complex subunit PrcB family protein n=1 Tax=Tenacibaculum sp. SG-28 TaxID=754426 RepID=UPI000CF54CFD|nr:protease complex subunit PrcB family protein [Tenacibaculum sp. SG-28]PQJ20618.1 hypothetical protein BSU00_09905 [Tenacibaculum sp. SG-28]